ATAGADWTCPYCGADNPRGGTQCVGCGATSEGAKVRAERVLLDQVARPPPRLNARKILGFIAVAFAVVLAAGWFLFIRTKAHELVGAGETWTKAVHVQRLEVQVREAWLDQVPSGARVVRRSVEHRMKKVHAGSERVKTGRRDLGNGYFEDVYEERP